MKNRILTFIIGVLVGANMTISGFLIYNIININVNTNSFEKNPMDGQMQQENGNMGEPPEKPNGSMKKEV